jgi:anti-anti-sigma factor
MILCHQVRNTPAAVRVFLSGEIDISVLDELHDVLHTAVAASPGVTEVDLGDVTFLDCAVIGEFVRAYLDARRRGQFLVVTRPRAFIREVLELANALPLLTSRPAALVGGDS